MRSRILNELRSALMGLYEAHRYFLVWLKDELFPAKSSLDDLVSLKPKHLLQKLRLMGEGGAPSAEGAGSGGDRGRRSTSTSTGDTRADAVVMATALLSARHDWRAMHGDAVRPCLPACLCGGVRARARKDYYFVATKASAREERH
jgi:hypothetical protein